MHMYIYLYNFIQYEIYIYIYLYHMCMYIYICIEFPPNSRGGSYGATIGQITSLSVSDFMYQARPAGNFLWLRHSEIDAGQGSTGFCFPKTSTLNPIHTKLYICAPSVA